MSITVEELEGVIEGVSNWAVDIIQKAVEALNPSGKPFQFEEQPIEKQIEDYILIRGNPEAWLSFIQSRSDEMVKRLEEAGVPPNEIASVHPFDIASKYAIAYSVFMEDELRKRA